MQRSELRVSGFLGICSTRSEQEFGSGRDGLAGERSKSQHKGLTGLPYGRLVSFGLVATWNSVAQTGKKKLMRAPCGAERKCGWAGMYRPSIA